MSDPEELGEKPKGKDNSVFIGQKPFMNYVTAVVMQFTTKVAQEVIVKAKDIKIDSEEFTNREGKNVRVSTIEIVLAKK